MGIKKFVYNTFFTSFNSCLIVYYNNLNMKFLRYIKVKDILGKFFFNFSGRFYNVFVFLCSFKFFFNFYNKLRSKKSFFLSPVYEFSILNQDLLNYFYLKSKVNLFLNLLHNSCYNLNMGLSDSLEITGYARRSWFSSSKKHIVLKVGKTHLDSVFISNKVLITLVRKRLIYLYTYNLRYLKKISYAIHSSKPADIYKGAGIILKSLNLQLKKRVILK